jgi:hypothetical protein
MKNGVETSVLTRATRRNNPEDTILHVFFNFNVCSKRGAVREEHKLRVFENRVLRRIFGPKRDVVT